jgi:osmoprotectant transport system ATP-binding protein
MLRLECVSKSYHGVPALRPTDLTVAAGRTTVLIGPSGCGKSTLVRLMAGLIQPDSGSVRFKDMPVTLANSAEFRRHLGFVVQDGGLFPHLTARRNATLMARHLGWDAARIDRRLAELTELTHFPAERLDSYPVQLSGGQRQRVSLMRALMLNPELLLLDEPLGALDPLIRSDLQADLRGIFQALHKTVVLVTHDLGEAGFLGDVLVLLRDGRVVQQGTLEQLVRDPADDFVRRFVNAQRQPSVLQEAGAQPEQGITRLGSITERARPRPGGPEV